MVLVELREALGVGIEQVVTPSALIYRLQRTGKPVGLPNSGGVTIQQSRVNGQMRLEIKGFEPSRLGWYKSLGCFTEIVQFKTRLFAPNADMLLAAIDGLSPIAATAVPSPTLPVEVVHRAAA